MDFFLKKEIEDPDRFFYDLENKIDKKMIKIFSMPPLPKENKSNQMGDFPLLDADSKDFSLNLAQKKILINFKGQDKKDIKKYLRSINPIIKKIFEFVEEYDIWRIGIILKLFISPKDEIKYLEKFVNKENFPNTNFRDISLKINWEGKVGKIPTNNIFNILKAIKETKKKKVSGLKIDLDINNLNERNLKKNEVNQFFNEIQQEIIKMVSEKMKW